jgi:phosphate transport system substrate-binding protein
MYPKAKVTPIYTNELEAVNLLLSDSLCLAITSRNFTKEEFDNLRAKGYQPVAIPIAEDGLSLICHRQNTDSCISVKDVRRILSGDATK